MTGMACALGHGLPVVLCFWELLWLCQCGQHTGDTRFGLGLKPRGSHLEGLAPLVWVRPTTISGVGKEFYTPADPFQPYFSVLL